ncbi:ABC transporter permease [Nakamurella flavida]|uniref:ABC transporter permease n=1 Tax=Nakamurella flavida TaxID=363630 RepID=A0A938YL97_9ACTN|nr:ABC transporter permease [Nakamurella flavida]MBM9475103.1 ABC transporter permease [Nakamurella flavida]MDP9776673.1 ribose transport system permease protein [Nakamurella flavida]
MGALVVLIVVFAVINPSTFLSIGNIRTILDQAATPLIVGVGATLIVLMGSIDLSVEGLMGAGGMAFILTTENSRGSADLGPLSFVIGIAMGAVLGMIAGAIHTRLKVPSFIVTLGFWFVGLGIATVLFGTETIPLLPDGGVKAWPNSTLLGLPHSFWLAVLVVAIGWVITRFTRLGRSAYAIGDNEEIARSNGIAVGRTKIAIFALAGACTGLAGVLATLRLGAGSPSVGGGVLFVTVAAVVIGGTSLGGGRGGVLRTLLGVLLLTVLTNGLILSGVDSSVQSGVSGAVLILAIVVAAWPQRSRLRIMK